MSVTLPVSVESVAPERIATDLLIAPFFETDRPLRGPAARIDWRLCGALSEQVARGRLAGAVGDAALLLTAGRVRADRVLLLGMGPKPGFGRGELRRVAVEAARRSLDLCARDVALSLPPERVLGIQAAAAAKIWLGGMAEAVVARPRPLTLRLVAAVSEAPPVQAAAVELARRSGGSVSVRPSRGVETAHPKIALGVQEAAQDRPSAAASPGASPRPRP